MVERLLAEINESNSTIDINMQWVLIVIFFSYVEKLG